MMSFTVKRLAFQDFGLTEYETVWALQKELVEKRLRDEIPDTVLMGEHPPVITLGRGSHAENLLHPSIPVIEIERGGDVTYHGPGQLIAYPIFKLEGSQRDLHAFLRKLEKVIIQAIEPLELQGTRNPGWTGVWVQEPQSGRLLKVASIGVAVKKWVTYHGLALNVSTDLSHFRQINPCGLESQVMASLSSLTGRSLDIQEVKVLLMQSFETVFKGNGNAGQH